MIWDSACILQTNPPTQKEGNTAGILIQDFPIKYHAISSGMFSFGIKEEEINKRLVFCQDVEIKAIAYGEYFDDSHSTFF